MATPKLEFRFLDVDEIRPNPMQPRENFSKESLSELSDSIKAGNVIQPIIVRQQGKTYQIIAGERRWRASQMAGLKQIPAIIKDIVDERVLLESVIENLHRLDLEDNEQENAIHELWENRVVLGFKTASDLASAIGVNPHDVENDLEAWEFRHKERGIPRSAPTYIIARTRGLPVDERKKLVEKVQEGEYQAQQAYTAVKVLRKAPEPVKRELLKPKTHVTPKMAETIVEKLPTREDQEAVLKETIQHRLTEDEVIARVQDIKRSREEGIAPTVERQIIIQGQWLVDRVRKPVTDLLLINPDAFSELDSRQRENVINLLTQLQERIRQWLFRLKEYQSP